MTKQEAPAPEPMVGKRRIMDFAPVSKPAVRRATRPASSIASVSEPVEKPKRNPHTSISHPKPDIAGPRRAPRKPAAVVTVSDADVDASDSKESVSEKIPTNAAPRKRLFMGDVMRPVKRKAPRPGAMRPQTAPASVVEEETAEPEDPIVKKVSMHEGPIVVESLDDIPLEEPVFDGPVAKSTVIESPAIEDEPIEEGPVEDESADEVAEEKVEETVVESSEEVQAEVPEVPETEEAPRKRGIRIDFMKKVSSAISSVRRGGQAVDVTTAAKNVAEEVAMNDPINDVIAGMDGAAEELAEEEKPATTEEIMTDAGSFTVADALDAMNAEEEEKAEIAESEDGLAEVLAGFADATVETPDLTDNLSPEVQDFEEEIDALEESEAVPDELLETPKSTSTVRKAVEKVAEKVTKEQKAVETTENFISEPTVLFATTGADPLVEQSLHRKRPEFKEPTTYIDGSPVRGAEKKKPPVEPYRQILGGRSPYLNSVPVEKRPLSGSVPTEPRELPKPKVVAEKTGKVSYKEKILKTIHEKSAPEKAEEPARRVAPAPRPVAKTTQTLEKLAPIEKKPKVQKETIAVPEVEGSANKFPLAIAVALTLVLGAVAGAFVYLVFLQ